MEAEDKMPKKPEGPTEKQIVQQLADDVALHGWKVRSYSTNQDLDKDERTLRVVLWRSTAEGEQQNLKLVPDRKRKGADAAAPAAEAGTDANEGEGT